MQRYYTCAVAIVFLLIQALLPVSAATLEEIIVTAQKREQSIQDIPIAVSAFGEDLINEIKAVNVGDISTRTPNFTMTEFNIGEPQYFIRGLGSTSDSAGSDPTVAMFIDEVYIGRGAASNFNFFDLERIEVLRGPQGTLFGRNTSGGAISVVTKKPSLNSTYAKFQGTVGNEDTYEVSATGNMPVSANAAVKGSFSYSEHGGYAENINTGEELDGGDNISGRLQLLFEPTDRTTVLLSADYARDDRLGNARLLTNHAATPPAGPLAPIISGFNAAIGAARNGRDIRDVFTNPNSFQKRDVHGLLARIDHETDYGTWTSITSYRDVQLDWFEDLSTEGSSGGLTNDDSVSESSDQFSQEVRLASLPDSDIQWVAGLYYFTESIDRSERFKSAFTGPLTFFDAVFGIGGDVSFFQDAETDSYAAFGQFTVPLPIIERLSFTGGVRYTYDEKDIRQRAVDNENNGTTPGAPLGAVGASLPGYDLTGSDSWEAITGKIGLEYTTESGNLLYGSISRGYKSGVFPSQSNSLADVTTALDPETVLNYELGVRTQTLNDRLRINISAFTAQYTDLQQFILDATLRLNTFNVDASVRGLEFESIVALSDRFQVGGNFSLMKSKVRGVTGGVPGISNGNELPRSPGSSFNVFGSYQTPLANGELSMRANYSWTDDFFHEVSNLPETRIDSYGLLDARIAYNVNNFEVAIWGKNLTDKEYETHIIPFLGSGFGLFGSPRTFGLTLTYHYDQ